MPRENGMPQIIRLDKAFKLQWVNNMSKTEEDDSAVSESRGRPDRLGLGAKVTRHSNIGPLNDPVERKLHSKLNARKRNFSSAYEVSIPSEVDGKDDDDDDDEPESRTKAFAKKQAVPLATSMEAKKKQK